ncbi:MAG TPA: hypothetical protein VD704_12215 [Gaiellaceae bacterium]|nr:hypothetical protein [Gaiellaceae bacterium]
MGWLNRLLGRERESGEAPRPPFDGPDEVAHAGETEVDAAEERVAEARDESLGLENRIPPGAG